MPSPSPSLPFVRTIAVLGDLHGKWSNDDVDFFNGSNFDLVVFVGDLGSGTRRDGLGVIQKLARLEKPTLVLPGNNDAEHLPYLTAELAFQAGRSALLSGRPRSAPIAVGYSRHEFDSPLGTLSLVVGRPLAQGGSRLSFGDVLTRTHGVASLEASRERYRSLVDGAGEQLLFVAHNGPYGLGEGRDALWGRDFAVAPEDEAATPRDFGDADLTDAIDYAKSLGKRVVGVVAGHMHRSRRSPRALVEERAATVFVNAAWVPRIVSDEKGSEHHYVALTFSDAGLVAEERFFRPSASPH